MSTTTKHPYLTGEGPEGMGPLRHIALFQSHDVARGRAVHALHMPVVSRLAGCHSVPLSVLHLLRSSNLWSADQRCQSQRFLMHILTC